MADHARPIGDFCWINILSPDLDAERRFFGAVFGWTFDELPGMGWLVKVDGRQVGGLFPNVIPATGERFPAGIGVMVRVADADASAQRMRTLGGHAAPPMPVGPQGTMVDGKDPSGALIDLWEPAAGGTIEAPMDAHGAPSWFELVTRDVARATQFYRDLFGWTSDVVQMPDFPYTILKREGIGIAGIMPHQPDMGEMAEYWAVYFTVQDPDATAATVTAEGGQVVIPPQDIPGIGRFLGMVSPRGVFCYAIRYAAR